MAATPLFLATDVGLAAASVATPTGPFVEIVAFKIGSAYGYSPSRSDTGLNGATLYSGVPISYQNIGDNTINIILQIPPEAGPFDFGEVGVYLPNDVMFGKAVFDTLQTKFSSLGTNLLSTYTFNCLIKLEQSTAIFQITTASGIPPAIWDVYAWSDVYPPGVSANPDTPAILIHELDVLNNSTLLHKANDDKWTLGTNYARYGERAVVSGTTSSVQFAQSQFPASPVNSVNNQFVLEFSDGFYRSVSSVVVAGSNYQFNLNPAPLLSLPTAGDIVMLHNNNGYSFTALTDVPLATQTIQGIAEFSHGLQIVSPGIIAVNGLNHDAPNTGRLLTSSDDLNTATLASGIYTVTGGQGYPGNYPPIGALPGVIHNSNTQSVSGNGSIVQTWYPTGTGGGDGSGTGGQPVYFRTLISAGSWSAWFPFTMPGKVGTGGTRTAIFSGLVQNYSYTNPHTSPGFYSFAISSLSSSGGNTSTNAIQGDLYINGLGITLLDDHSGNGSHADTVCCVAYPGESMYINTTTYFGYPCYLNVTETLI